MPFRNGEYNSTYEQAKPLHQVHEFHMMITQVEGYRWAAIAAKQHQDTIDELYRAGEALKKALLSRMIEFCIDETHELLPLHVEISEALWVEYNNKLQQRRQEKGLHVEEGDSTLLSLRESADRIPKIEGWPKLDCLAVPDADERQYTLGETKIYRVRCGPLRCGIRREDDTCPHGVVTLLGEAPPCWIDGVGWPDGENPFQVANQGRWKTPRYALTDGHWIGPWSPESMYSSYKV